MSGCSTPRRSMAKRKPKPVSARARRLARQDELILLQDRLHLAMQRITDLERTVRGYQRRAQQMRRYEEDRRRTDANEAPLSPREKELEWDALDRAAASVTQHERELFEASPAYQKYQQWRQTSGLVKKGDWRAP